MPRGTLTEPAVMFAFITGFGMVAASLLYATKNATSTLKPKNSFAAQVRSLVAAPMIDDWSPTAV